MPNRLAEIAAPPRTLDDGTPRWRVQLLGRFELSDGQRTHTRLATRAMTALLARLALWPQRDHPREELAELLWPGTDAGTGRRRLRQTLSLLKHLLEPLEQHGAAPVVLADRLCVRLVPGSLDCDVRRFERLVQARRPADALAAYGGELLPGHYDDWIQDERLRLAALHGDMEALAAAASPVPASVAGTIALARHTSSRASTASGRTQGDSATLPHMLTRYIATAGPLRQLRDAVGQHRWVTVVGPGGSGKTRLVVELARQLQSADERPDAAGPSQRPDGQPVAGSATSAGGFDRVLFVPLVSASTAEQMLALVGKALRIAAPNPTHEALVARLAGWKTLLVLDNVEQLVGVADGAVVPSEVPDASESPEAPEAPEESDAPAVPAVPAVPALPALPALPPVPAAPAAPAVQAVPTVPTLAACPALAALAAAAPRLHLLLTSRRPTGVDGEREFPMAALPTPAGSQQATDLATLAANPAVALFVDRASAVRLDFHLGPRNAAVVAGLVTALEGMPLAIELAASRLRSVSPAEMLARLRPSAAPPGHTPQLDLLARPEASAGAARDPRHASMQRAIAWSWEQLSPAQRDLAGTMAVFSGGCTAAMLQQVHRGSGSGSSGSGSGSDSDSSDSSGSTGSTGSTGGDGVLRDLDQLLAHSLAHPVGHAAAQTGLPDSGQPAGAQPDGDQPEAWRFQLYEPVREHAGAQLAPALAAQARARHRAWVTAWARALPQTPALAQVRAEASNLAAALHSARHDGAGADAVQLLLALDHTREDVELPAAALDDAGAAIDHACPDAALRSRGHSALGPMLFAAGRTQAALRHVEAALQHTHADPALQGRALYAAARLRWRTGLNHPERVLPMVEQADALAAAAADVYLQAGLLSLRAWATQVLDGTPQRALALHQRALTHWQAFGNCHAVNLGRYNVAVFEFECGRPLLALQQLDEIAADAAALQDWRRVSVVDNARGSILSALRRWPEALQALRGSLRLSWQAMSLYNLAYDLWNLPRALAHAHLPAQALTVMAFAQVFWQQHYGAPTASDRFDVRRVDRLAARQLPARACAEARAQGRVLSLADAVALALADG